jgi:uncharacterized protein
MMEGLFPWTDSKSFFVDREPHAPLSSRINLVNGGVGMTVRELTEADRETALGFLQKNPALNLFLIGDIIHYGFEQDFQQVWGDFDAQGSLRSVLLRYYNSYIPYAEGTFDVAGLAAILEQETKMDAFSGIDYVTEAFRGNDRLPLQWDHIRKTYFAELKEWPALDVNELREIEGKPVQWHKMKVEDIPALVELIDCIEEFEAHAVDSFRHSLETGSTRGYWLEREGRAIAMARTAAENPYSAMIIGVGTHPDFRKKGLATQLMIRLCRELRSEGKSVCLFYDNPKAGTIYKRLGFRDIGRWNMIKAKKKGEVSHS